jgi:hypothetical protein
VHGLHHGRAKLGWWLLEGRDEQGEISRFRWKICLSKVSEVCTLMGCRAKPPAKVVEPPRPSVRTETRTAPAPCDGMAMPLTAVEGLANDVKAGSQPSVADMLLKLSGGDKTGGQDRGTEAEEDKMKGGKALVTRVGDSVTVVEWTQCGSEALDCDSFQGLLPP